MWISRYVCMFLIYSYLGWLFETSLCTVKCGKWENRGFLYGPVVPIYSAGALAITVVVDLTAQKGIVYSPWSIYCISVLGSAVLEYITSWAMEKIFHALWWDYSGLPLNVQGRISLFTSLGFGIAGLVIVYAIVPLLERFMNNIPSILIELLSLCLVFLFAVDVTVTVTALHHFDRIVIRVDESFNQSMTYLVDGVMQRTNQVKQGIRTKRAAVAEELNTMSDFAKKAVHRVYIFRDKDERIQAAKNKLLSVVKSINRNNKPDDTDDG